MLGTGRDYIVAVDEQVEIGTIGIGCKVLGRYSASEEQAEVSVCSKGR